MRRAVLITRQAISPRFAIRIRLNMCLLTSNLGAGSSLARPIWHAGMDVTIPSYSKTEPRQRLFEPEFARGATIQASKDGVRFRRIVTEPLSAARPDAPECKAWSGDVFAPPHWSDPQMRSCRIAVAYFPPHGAAWGQPANKTTDPPGQVWYQAASRIIYRGDRFRSGLSSREPVKSAGRRIRSAAQAPTQCTMSRRGTTISPEKQEQG